MRLGERDGVEILAQCGVGPREDKDVSLSRAHDPVFWQFGASVRRALDRRIFLGIAWRQHFNNQRGHAIDTPVVDHAAVFAAHGHNVRLDRVASRHEQADWREGDNTDAGIFELCLKHTRHAADDPLVKKARRGGSIQHSNNHLVAVAVVGQLRPARIAPVRIERARGELWRGCGNVSGHNEPRYLRVAIL